MALAAEGLNVTTDEVGEALHECLTIEAGPVVHGIGGAEVVIKLVWLRSDGTRVQVDRTTLTLPETK